MKKIILAVALVAFAAVAGGDTLSALFSLTLNSEAKRVSGETVTRQEGRFRAAIGFTNGTATTTSEANAKYSVRGEVSSASAVAYDLLSLTDPFGASMSLSRLKLFAIHNLDATDSLRIGSGTSAFAFGMATQTVITVAPQGVVCFSAPYGGWDASVTASLVRIESDNGLASFDLELVGVK